MRRMFVLLLFLTACQSPPPGPEVPDTPVPTLLAGHPSPLSGLSPTDEPPVLAPISTEAAAISESTLPTPTFQSSNLPSSNLPSSNLPSFHLCSPLSLHPLAELPLVIGDPYDPPRPGREERHHGIDFAYYHYAGRDTMQGEPIQAVLPGVVASALHDLYPYGNMVMVETTQAQLPPDVVLWLGFQPGESLYVLYAHMHVPPTVSLGDTVEACQPLGEVGMTGNTELPHLHLETRLGPASSTFESMRYYDTRASLEELAAYELWRTSGLYRHFDPMTLLSFHLAPTLPILADP